jgi:hypothetical protein
MKDEIIERAKRVMRNTKTGPAHGLYPFQWNRDSVLSALGFAEYYDPHTAEPCGGAHFTWTAAMVIEILSSQAD